MMPWTGQVSQKDGNGNESFTEYDARGNVISVTDAAGDTTTSTYDGLDRVLTVVQPESIAVTYVWDAASRLETYTDSTKQVDEVDLRRCQQTQRGYLSWR